MLERELFNHSWLVSFENLKIGMKTLEWNLCQALDIFVRPWTSSPGRLLNFLRTFDLHPVSRREDGLNMRLIKEVNFSKHLKNPRLVSQLVFFHNDFFSALNRPKQPMFVEWFPNRFLYYWMDATSQNCFCNFFTNKMRKIYNILHFLRGRLKW